MTNFDLTQKVFDFLKQVEVEIVVVCAGARNAPLVMALEKTNLKVIPFFEERSASFFALGLIKAYEKPVAIICTSGTAVAEILPAAIEATYQGLPLVILSADRPKSYRKSGAPQSIQQVGLFSNYVESVHDLDVETKEFDFHWSYQKPIHLNICFDEPLVDKASATADAFAVKVLKSQKGVQDFKEIKIKNPLVIVSDLNRDDVDFVQNFLLKSKSLVYAEALSQLSRAPNLKSQLLTSSDTLVKKAFTEKIFDSVIRIGGVPTLRFWRDLETDFADVPVFNFTHLDYSGLARASQTFDLSHLKNVVIQGADEKQALLRRDHELQKEKINLLEKYPFSEPACVFRFSQINAGHSVYLGNSLPIRHWDAFAVGEVEKIYANRGANGIDGQISTYLGWSENLKQSSCLIGDLTAMYDLAALGLTSQLASNLRQVVVLNNFGGQIFQRVFKNNLFVNPHQIQFKPWAQMWNWDYKLVSSPEDFASLKNNAGVNSVVEIQPSAKQTELFWNEWDLACQKI